MREQDGHMHLEEEEASGGSKENVVRWVLAGGLLLAIILLSVVWIIPALNKADNSHAERHDRAVEQGRPDG